MAKASTKKHPLESEEMQKRLDRMSDKDKG